LGRKAGRQQDARSQLSESAERSLHGIALVLSLIAVQSRRARARGSGGKIGIVAPGKTTQPAAPSDRNLALRAVFRKAEPELGLRIGVVSWSFPDGSMLNKEPGPSRTGGAEIRFAQRVPYRGPVVC
jgi:hypothetical protein